MKPNYNKYQDNTEKNKIKISLTSNSERCENVSKCHQLRKRTCIALEVGICVNETAWYTNYVYYLN